MSYCCRWITTLESGKELKSIEDWKMCYSKRITWYDIFVIILMCPPPHPSPTKPYHLQQWNWDNMYFEKFCNSHLLCNFTLANSKLLYKSENENINVVIVTVFFTLSMWMWYNFIGIIWFASKYPLYQL